MRTNECTPEIRRGRLRKASQFYDAATLLEGEIDNQDTMADAYAALCILAGIAASDVICCASLGQYPRGENHHQAASLLAKADEGAARHLRTILAMKTKAEYTETPISPTEAKRVARAAAALLETARRLNTS